MQVEAGVCECAHEVTGGFGRDPASPQMGWPQIRPNPAGNFVIDGGGAKPYFSRNAEVASVS
ncbi:MAG TPA: hypothetical protein VG838_03620 [Opitutaceae bacterium]|nr:hypothetical protein [Opitutaceae bacterium]